MPDRIEAGTFLCAGAITGGNILLKDVTPEHLVAVLNKLEESGCKLNIAENEIKLNAPRRLKNMDIITEPYPGFPTDMQPIFGSMLSASKGYSTITEKIFENRYKYITEMQKMGAKIDINDRVVTIKGIRKLKGNKVVATDLRGGAALVIAGLNAKGITEVDNIEHILRGYERFDEKLTMLGAKIVVEI